MTTKIMRPNWFRIENQIIFISVLLCLINLTQSRKGHPMRSPLTTALLVRTELIKMLTVCKLSLLAITPLRWLCGRRMCVFICSSILNYAEMRHPHTTGVQVSYLYLYTYTIFVMKTKHYPPSHLKVYSSSTIRNCMH